MSVDNFTEQFRWFRQWPKWHMHTTASLSNMGVLGIFHVLYDPRVVWIYKACQAY